MQEHVAVYDCARCAQRGYCNTTLCCPNPGEIEDSPVRSPHTGRGPSGRCFQCGLKSQFRGGVRRGRGRIRWLCPRCLEKE